MKAVLVFWVIGCLFIGYPIGKHAIDCPTSKMPTAVDMFVYVAIWPAFFTMAFAGKPPPERSGCEAFQ